MKLLKMFLVKVMRKVWGEYNIRDAAPPFGTAALFESLINWTTKEG
jgi:hypothetical protein